jgi:hypothetical protein
VPPNRPCAFIGIRIPFVFMLLFPFSSRCWKPFSPRCWESLQFSEGLPAALQRRGELRDARLDLSRRHARQAVAVRVGN